MCGFEQPAIDSVMVGARHVVQYYAWTLPHFGHMLCLCFNDATAGSLMGMSLVRWMVNCLWVAS